MKSIRNLTDLVSIQIFNIVIIHMHFTSKNMDVGIEDQMELGDCYVEERA